MDVDAVGASPIGRLEPIEVYDRRFDETFKHAAYVPDPLPEDPALQGRTWALAAQAEGAVARLDGAAGELPHPLLIVRPMIRREAVSTSALEGTHSPIDELLGAEASKQVERPETREVLNYVEAVERGLELLDERPVSLNLINELHAILLKDVRGDSHQAGRLREHQNWIGDREGTVTDAPFVPPPPTYLPDAFGRWEKWIHRSDLPVVVRIALGHYQFETLHPYTDGNGRLGRLVIVLQLVEEGVLRDHLLTISPYLESRREEYVAQLRNLTLTGDHDTWVQFFSQTLIHAAEDSISQIRELEQLRDDAVDQLRSDGVKGAAVQIAENLLGYPAMTVSEASERADVSYQAAKRAIDKLVDRGILEGDDRTYNRVYYSPSILALLRRPSR